ncbi:MAG: MFS transporter [Lacticaseibacillus absianus]
MDAHEKVAPSVIWSIVGTAGVACSGVLVETSMNVTFPTLMKVFNQSLNNVQWITTAYLLAVTLTIVLAAYLQRSFKFKNLIIAAGTASVIGGAICMLANSLPVMLLGRIIQGIGTGIAMPLLFSIIMLEVPRAKQGSFVGTAGMIIALAPSLGPTYGGICLSALSWRFNFIFTLPITIIFCIIAACFMSDNEAHRDHFNFSEYLLIVLALIVIFHVMFMTGFSMMYNNSMTIGLQQLEVMHIADGNALFNMLQQYSGSIGTAAMSVIIAIAGSPYKGQSKQVVMGSQAAFIVLFVFTILIFACVLSLIKRDKQGMVKK